MNITQLNELIKTDPYGKGSTSRMVLRDGTLWYKHDDNLKTHYPLISHMGDFTITWGSDKILQYGYVHTKTARLVRNAMQTARGYWNEYSEKDSPRISIRMNNGVYSMCSSTDFSVLPEHVTSGITKSLATGFNPHLVKIEEPDSGFYRNQSDKDTNYTLGFKGVFENVTRGLAYGAISRENWLKGEANKLAQRKTQLIAEMTSAEEELLHRASTYFAPTEDEKASGDVYLKEIDQRLNTVAVTAENLRSECNRFNQVANASESLAFRQSHADFACYAYTDKGEVETKRVNRNYINDRDTQSLSLSLGTITLTDNNVNAFSFYWMQKHFDKYAQALRACNCIVPDLFDQRPEDWDYTQLAAPLFMAQP